MGNFFSNIFDGNAPKNHEQEATANNTNLRWVSSNDEQPITIQRFPSSTTNNSSIFTKYSRSEDDDKRRDHDQLIIKQTRDERYEYRKLLLRERSITHYNSSQKILLVGEGDFSFSASLANAFRSATNMVATSLDSEETLEEKYSRSRLHIRELRRMGCMVLNDVGVHDMLYDPTLKNMKFDRIIFNFPHAGHFPPHYETESFLIAMHMKLLSGFFKSSSKMLNEGGEVHVSHRDDYPYNTWEIKKLANLTGLQLIEKVRFRKADYPGYSNKRGGDIESDKEFYLGDRPYTFKFSSSSKSTIPTR